jgi:geranylgeranylglycerol-phosphate geranylgeranyltransferase
MGRIGGLIRIIRPVNALMVGFGILVGVVITGGLTSMIPLFYLALAFITGFTLTGSAMAVNDYYDREIDAVNEPTRPIPSGSVKPSEALALSAFLSIIGLASAWAISLECLGLALFSWLVMMVYSSWGKRTGFPGNLMVSTCIALPFIYGGLLTSKTPSAILFSLIAFLSNTGREVTKGIVDIEGDRKEGVRTLAVSLGPRAASLAAVFFYLLAVAASVLPLYLGLVSIWYMPFVVVTDFGLIYGSVVLIREPSRENSRRVKNSVLYWMLMGLLAFAAGGLF